MKVEWRKTGSAVLAALVGWSLPLVACSPSGPAPTPTPEPSGVVVSLTTVPAEPQSGDVELVIQVQDADDRPITNADVYVFMDHTEMQGMNMNGKATPQGNGRYTLTTNLSMAGRWKISVQVRKPPVNTMQDFTLQVK